MYKKIDIEFGQVSQNDKNLIETEINVLAGVIDVSVNENGEGWVEFDDKKISQEDIFRAINKLGFGIKSELINRDDPREYTYFVRGMHCASCEILIEKKLLEFKEVKSVEAKAGSGEVLIEYIGHRPEAKKLNCLFKKDNYVFFDEPVQSETPAKKGLFSVLFAAAVLIFGFLLLNKTGFSSLVNISSSSSLPTFFVFGLLAGVSSCAALVGGIVLSMSKQWLSLYSDKDSTAQKLNPHLMFGIGRLIAYVLFGAILGAIGSQLKISLGFTSFLIIVISVMMFFLGLQMLGVKKFRKFQFTLPKFISRYVADETNFRGRKMPFLMGALTFFLPCGFTITAQGITLLSGNAFQGAMIMLAFALGTAPALLVIGLSSVKFSSRPHLGAQFAKVAGILVLFFAIFNINNQMNVLGYSNLSDIKLFGTSAKTDNFLLADESVLPPIVNGKQVLKMDALAYGYQPNSLKVRLGVPVRWEITDKGTSGCTNAIISKGLFPDKIPLTPGQVSVKEFTPTKTGKFKFSCWMGMASGVIEVIDADASGGNSRPDAVNAAAVPSGAAGCGGCGGETYSCH